VKSKLAGHAVYASDHLFRAILHHAHEFTLRRVEGQIVKEAVIVSHDVV
jgi:hypothetical protein